MWSRVRRAPPVSFCIRSLEKMFIMEQSPPCAAEKICLFLDEDHRSTIILELSGPTHGEHVDMEQSLSCDAGYLQHTIAEDDVGRGVESIVCRRLATAYSRK